MMRRSSPPLVLAYLPQKPGVISRPFLHVPHAPSTVKARGVWVARAGTSRQGRREHDSSPMSTAAGMYSTHTLNRARPYITHVIPRPFSRVASICIVLY